MAESLKVLLDLQDADLSRDRNEEKKSKLPALRDLAECNQRLQEVRATMARIRTDLDDINREATRLEGDISVIDAKIAREEVRLYSGDVKNPKELSALQDELGMLQRRKAPLEEGLLEQMLARDEANADLDRLAVEDGALSDDAAALQSVIEAECLELDRAIALDAERRESLAPQLPAQILSEYEDLRARKRGIGVGALASGACSACREALSAVEVDRIRKLAREGEQLFHCEHCRRLLVVIS